MISKPKKPVEKPKKSVEKPKKSVEKPKKSVEKTKKPVEKPKKPVEKPKKSVEKPKKPVEKPKKSVEKPKKSVEKPKKSVPKKRVKNVNVDKIVKIIKKCIIKCGFKNPKLKGGGLKDLFKSAAESAVESGKKMYNKITSKVSKNEGEGECFKNLKNIDDVFKYIHTDVVDARKNLLKYLKEKRTETNKDLFDRLLSKYKFMVADDDNSSSFHNYKYNTTINVDLKIHDIDKITIEKYLIVYIIDIVEQLERFREGMLSCARKEWVDDNKDNTVLTDYNDDKKDLFKHAKDDDNDSDTVSASTAAPMSSSVSVAPIGVVVSDVDPVEDKFEDAVEELEEQEEQETIIQRSPSGSSLGTPPPSSRRPALYLVGRNSEIQR